MNRNNGVDSHTEAQRHKGRQLRGLAEALLVFFEPGVTDGNPGLRGRHRIQSPREGAMHDKSVNPQIAQITNSKREPQMNADKRR